ncbi:myb-like protein X [Leguminivora glycinivorella]|uniref:myb-like protein X n=1 Tax=Leguminivora glycinivorella TaxID=1035111 RepID=UPI00200D3FF3|nr:myb-like protein X [Leguminivora glycinivorella]
MSGKSYTLREMKSIVDYLTENHLYDGTRGRKMWMDFANSNKTVRTWQSLKETFLKRILPDITNPYYRLDPDQILSFKRGINLTQKDRKLELRSVNTSKTNGANDENDQPSTSKKDTEENGTGEDTQCSKVVHNRASTETLILDTCYQTADDMQSDLEDNKEQNEDNANKSKPALKSVRDFIEYTEPLTPMLQEVLNDFATDEDCSDADPPMQIDENYVAQEETSDAPENPTSSQSILKPNKTQYTGKITITEEKVNEQDGNTKHDQNNTDEPVIVPDDTTFSQLEDVMVLVDEALAQDIDKELSKKIESQDKEASSNQSIPMTDSLLPNNQEAIKNHTTIEGPSPCDESGQGTRKDNERDSTSKTNMISDVEPEKKGEGLITIDSNEEKANNKETTKEKPTPKSPKSPKKSVNDDKVHEIHSDSSTGNKDVDSKVENPCLKSVSLFDQLSTAKYSDSDSNNKENANDQREAQVQNSAESKKNKDPRSGETEINDQNNEKRNTKKQPQDGVILLNSRTTSESVDDSDIHHRPLARSSLKIQKDKKLASVFGYSNGDLPKSRRLNGGKRTTSHRKMQSDSSDWTSTSDSEYVSPPHGRRNRYARKYLKPRSARIMSLDEEGGLFVMLGKKVYPLIKDGKLVKNYVTFLPESDPEEDDSYWKSKYIEERKRTDELKKKLGHSKPNGVLDKEEKESSISVSSVTSPLTENRARLPSRQESIQGNEVMRRYSGVMEKPVSKETLKIKFTKNDQEVQLEGHWQHINPVLAQVVSILHKDSDKKADTVTCVELSSGNTTPVTPNIPTAAPMDTGVHDKVNELESAIFKEIEEKDQKEEEVHSVEEPKENKEKTMPADNAEVKDAQENAEGKSNITQRKKRGRPKREVSPAVVTQSPAKKPKKSVELSKIVEEVKAQEVDNRTPNARPVRSPRKLLNGITPKARTTRKSSAKAQQEAPVETVPTPVIEENDDDEVRYKFPSPVPEEQTAKAKTSPKKLLPNIASPESLSHHSATSSQGYLDSDTSPFKINFRRKRRLSVSTVSLKSRKMKRKQRSRSYPLLRHIFSDSDSSCTITFKTSRKEQSTINSEVYRSDSYQFLMPRSQSMNILEKIEEANGNETEALANEIRNLRDEIMKANDSINKTDPASSSILSLPLSPELSYVENLSVSKSAIAEVNDHPTINEMESNTAQKTCNNKYLMSEVDVSMPLMNQDCDLQEKYRKHIMAAMSILSDAPNSAGRNLSNNSSMRMSITSESILKTYSGLNVESSDSLDRRLEQLLLESAQKPAKEEEKMEVDTQVKKRGSRKRCSTPHKKNAVHNKKKVNQEPVIVEESKVRCSRGGRRSCPPSVNIVYCEQNVPDNLEINIQDERIDVTAVNKKPRIKKDVIKVKITKPQKKKSPKKKQNISRGSNTEGDNESGVFLHGFDDSSELIHNHTETCLQIGDCMNQDDSDSVEFIDTTSKSIISLTSSVASENKENLGGNSTMESSKTTAELYCDNAQCATDLREARATEVRSADSGNTMYFTPFSSRCNSALTEDLSPPLPKPRASKWLFKEGVQA